MQEVSQAWKDNQNAPTQAQGFVNVQIISEDRTENLSSLDAQNYIKSTKHSRSFDPMGLELPTNNLTLELYNYDNKYLAYYENYLGQPIQIDVQYGYILNGEQEIIQGAIFEVDTIDKNDDVIIFKAISWLEKNQDSVITFTAQKETQYAEGDFSVEIEGTFNNDNYYKNPDITDERIYLKTKDIISCIDNKLNYDVKLNLSKNSIIATNAEITQILGEIILYTTNAELSKTIINRKNQVCYEKYPLSQDIKISNIIKNFDYATTKYLKQISTNTITASRESTEYKLIESYGIRIPSKGQYSVAGHYSISKTAPKIFKTATAYRVSVSAFSDSTSNNFELSNMIYTYNATKDVGVLEFDSERLYINNDYIEITIKFHEPVIATTTAKTTTTVSNLPYGEVCDVTNLLYSEIDTEAIANYFNNRDLYTISLRGDPARDVGDFAFMEMPDGEYKKALILSSDLTFDGVFTEVLTVRIINTDFTEIETGETDLKYFTITDGVLTAFDYESFQADELTSLTLPFSVTEIGDSVFSNCSTITEFNLHPFLKKIGDYAFSCCNGITRLDIPDSVESVGTGMLQTDEKSKLKTLTLSEKLTVVPQMFASGTAIESIVIPNSVTVIESMAFYNCTALENIKLSNKLTSIGIFAFEDCISLKKCVFPSGIKTYDNTIFVNCTSLEGIMISPGTEEINKLAQNCGSFKIIIPSTVKTISLDAFTDTTPVIWGYKDSAAETFAKENGFEFVDIEKNITEAYI